jgi:hypothetical protein
MNNRARSYKTYPRNNLGSNAGVISYVLHGQLIGKYRKQRRPETNKQVCPQASGSVLDLAFKAD